MSEVAEAILLDGDLDVVTATRWCAKELSGVDLGDKRLNTRLVDTAGKLAAQPQAPINQACDDWADAKGSYRLFQSEKASVEKILAPHQLRTQERMERYPLVLAVQDTTYLDYTEHRKTKGMGPIGTPKQNMTGLVMHDTLILTPQGLPLGLLTKEIWARDANAEPLSGWERRKQPIEEKESYKWIKALRKTVSLMPEGVQGVTVCDREGDVYELFVEAEQLETGLLVRAMQDRVLEEADTEVKKLWAQAEAAPVTGHLRVEVPTRDKEPKREAIVSVRFCRVTLKPPWRSKQLDKDPLEPVTLHVVLVQEVKAPRGAKPLEWLLITNVAVQSFGEAVERIKWYRCRWHIEVYFKVLKSGCRVEDCRLGTAERLKRFIALLSIIAWRLYWMTHINRHAPDAPCTTIMAKHEWRALYATIQRPRKLPENPPTVCQAIRWIAQLGGFLGRKGDAEPGVTTIWRGWQRLHDISATWLLLQEGTYG
jgi:hypothetical protein